MRFNACKFLRWAFSSALLTVLFTFRSRADGFYCLRLPRRIVRRIFVHRVSGPGAGDQDDHRLVACHREMRPARGFGVD
jgi:hypothetical protein